MRKRKHKKTIAKLGLLFTILLILLASISMSYAAWTDTITIEGTVSTAEDFNYLCLEGWWKFDEGSGSTAYDSSWNSNDGTVYGASWTSGKVDGALLFDGIDDYVQVPDDDTLDITDEITVMAWVNADTWDNPTAPYNNRQIIDKGEHASGKGFGLYSHDNSYIRFRLNKDSNAVVDSTFLPSTGNWHHIACTYDGSNIKLYIDGSLDNEASSTGSITTNDMPIYIGGAVNRNYYFDGLIDEVKIYSCALDASEILAEYNAGL